MAHKFHPFCLMIPEMDQSDYERLKASIAAIGLQEPILRWGAQIIDGRSRLMACEETGTTPTFKEWRPSAKSQTGAQQDDELWLFLLAKNLDRRHLSVSQKAMVAAARATAGDGNPALNRSNTTTVTNRESAEEVGVSEKSVDQAKAVLAHGSKPLVEAVRDGEVTVSDAAKIVDLPKAEQTAAVKAVASGEAKTVTAAAKPKKTKPPAADREPGEDAPEPEHAEPILDSLKGAVPESLHDVFKQVADWKAAMTAISTVKASITALVEHPASAWLDVSETDRLLTQARTNLKFALPYTECPKCRRKPEKKCPHCKGLGWLPEQAFKACASDADKAWLAGRKA